MQQRHNEPVEQVRYACAKCGAVKVYSKGAFRYFQTPYLCRSCVSALNWARFRDRTTTREGFINGK